MIVAIQQPEHLPWIGFFNKMAHVDKYVYLDNVQFKKRYFENRNKIKTKDGIKWITVPVNTKEKYHQQIKDVEINNSEKWKKKYIGAIEHGYKKTPFWSDVREIVFPCLEKDVVRLVDLNIMLIERCREYLDIKTPTILSSSLEVDSFSGSEIILNICIQAGAKTYMSGPDGRGYLKSEEYEAHGIRIVFHDFEHAEYPQMNEGFDSHLSVIDIIANLGPGSSALIKNCYEVKI